MTKWEDWSLDPHSWVFMKLKKAFVYFNGSAESFSKASVLRKYCSLSVLVRNMSIVHLQHVCSDAVHNDTMEPLLVSVVNIALWPSVFTVIYKPDGLVLLHWILVQKCCRQIDL